MARKQLNNYYIRVYIDEKDAAGNNKKKTIKQQSSNAALAIKHALERLDKRGVHNVISAKIVGDVLPCSELKKTKPNLDKLLEYYAVYEGTKLCHYEHKVTGNKVTPAEYKEL